MPSQVMALLRGWLDPAVRHERVLGRARVGVRRRIVTAAGLVGATGVLIPYHGISVIDAGWAAAAASFGVSAFMASRRVRRLERLPPPARRPSRSSSARPAVDRLSRAQAALTQLLRRLGSLADDTAREAAAAEHSLRDLAACIDSVDSALAVVPAQARVGLGEARALLLARLDEGTVAFERLVAAAADCVAAAAGGSDSGARGRLHEATDRLHGLAAGLSEAQGVSPQILP